MGHAMIIVTSIDTVTCVSCVARCSGVHPSCRRLWPLQRARPLVSTTPALAQSHRMMAAWQRVGTGIAGGVAGGKGFGCVECGGGLAWGWLRVVIVSAPYLHDASDELGAVLAPWPLWASSSNDSVTNVSHSPAIEWNTASKELSVCAFMIACVSHQGRQDKTERWHGCA